METFYKDLLNFFRAGTEQKKKAVVEQASKLKDQNRFIEYLDDIVKKNDYQISSLFDFIIEYGVSVKDQLSQEMLNHLVSIFIQLLSLKPSPSSFVSFSNFLTIAFSRTEENDMDKIFNSLQNLPSDIAILPMTYFAIQNKVYMQSVLDTAMQSIDQIIDNDSSILRCHSLILLYNNIDDSVTFDIDKIYSCAEVALSYPKVPVSQKFQLLEASLNILNKEKKLSLIDAHFTRILYEISVDTFIGGMPSALSAAVTVYKVVDESKQRSVCDAVFEKIMPFYKSDPSIDEALIKFCGAIDIATLTECVSGVVERSGVDRCTLFILSRFPIDVFVPLLFGIDKQIVDDFQYNCIIHYLLNQKAPSKYLPELMRSLSCTDMSMLDSVLEQRPHVYCTAAVKYLARCDDISKIEFIAARLASRASLPYIRTRSLEPAFINVGVRALQSTSVSKPLQILLQYLFACRSKKPGDSANSADSDATDEASGEHWVAPARPFGQSCENFAVENSHNEESSEFSSAIVSASPSTENVNNTSEVNDAKPPEDSEENDKPTEKIEKSSNNQPEEEEHNENKEEEEHNENKEEEEHKENKEEEEHKENKEEEEHKENKEEEEHKEKAAEKRVHIQAQSSTVRKIILSKDYSSSSLLNLKDEDAANLPDKDFFKPSEATFLADVSPAAVIHHICHRSPDWCASLVNVLSGRIRDGEVEYCILVGAVSGDSKLIAKCIRILDKKPSILAHFFSTAMCASPHITIKEMMFYIEEAVTYTESLFYPKQKHLPEDRLEAVLHAIITFAPFVEYTDELDEILRMAFTHITSSSSRNRVLFAMEALRAVCAHVKTKRDFSGFIEPILHYGRKLDPFTFSECFTEVVGAMDEIKPELAVKIADAWFDALVSFLSVDHECRFEQKFLDRRFQDITLSPFMKAMDRAYKDHETCQQLYICLARVINLRSVPPQHLQKYITICIANSMSKNIEIRKFCVNTLRSTQKIQHEIPNIAFDSMGGDVIEVVRPFYYELSQRFTGQTAVFLLDALMQHFLKCPQECRTPILVIADCLVSNEVDSFATRKSRLVIQLLKAPELLEKGSPLLMTISMILFKLANANMETFFEQLISIPSTPFTEQLVRRLYGNIEFSKKFTDCVFKYTAGIIKSSDATNVPRIINCLSQYISHSVFAFSEPETVSSLLHSFLVCLSMLMSLRKQKKSIEVSLLKLQQAMQAFSENSTLILCTELDLADGQHFARTISTFVSQFSRLPSETVTLFLGKVFEMAHTQHASTGGLVFAHIVNAYRGAYSAQGKEMLQKSLSMFFSYIREAEIVDTGVIESLMEAVSLFTDESFRMFSQAQVQSLLALAVENADRYPERCLNIVSLALRCADSETLTKQIGTIIAVLRLVSRALPRLDAECLRLMEAALAIKCESRWFVKDSPISFSSLTVRLVKSAGTDDAEVVKRTLSHVLGVEGQFDAPMAFATMQAILGAAEGSQSHFISICDQVSQLQLSGSEQLKTAAALITILATINDPNASGVVDRFMNSLRQMIRESSDVRTVEIALDALAFVSAAPRKGK